MLENEVNIKRILSRSESADFIGRKDEIEAVLQHSKGDSQTKGMLILSAPANGLSELFRQAYDRIFAEQGEVIPVYFSFSRNIQSPEQFAKYFLQTILLQAVAFRRNDPSLLDASPEICEISELAVPSDAHWIDRLVSACESSSRLKDERSFVKQALSAPLRAKAGGANLFVMFDNFQYIENVLGETNVLDEMKEVYQRSSVPYILGGFRRYILNAAQGGNPKLQETKILRLDSLTDSDAGLLVSNLSQKTQIKTNPQTIDLIVQQFFRNPSLINTIFLSAQEKGIDLDSFYKVQQVYVDSILGGRIGKFFETVVEEITPNLKIQNKIIDLLANDDRKTSIETWRKFLNIDEIEFRKIINWLHIHEFIRINSGMIEFTSEKETISDYFKTRYRLDIVGEGRALIVGNLLADALKRAPNIMTRFYRRSSAIGLRQLLSAFNCQTISAGLLDYEIFKEKYKGESETEIVAALDKETGKIEFPQVVYTANCVSFYSPIGQFLDDERCAVGFGFEKGNYLEETEIVWIAAEIDSKLEATKELTEFWCDRLEMVALMCNFLNYQLWLITPEGFSPEAIEVLKQRKAFGSSRHQVELLIKDIKAENLVKEHLKANEYEIIVPMGDDTEMIAAHTVEDIARRHSFPPRAINQIKTALVEACINAAEHSLSPDRRIYQKFTVEDDKIIITISNRGVKIPSNKLSESIVPINPDEGRRGWGLKLMQNLMDEVKFEQVDDGTRISMVKYLKKVS